MIKKLVYIYLVILIAAICLSPRFPLGTLFPGRNIDIRAEDIVLSVGLILGIAYILSIGKSKLKAPPLFWPIATWSVFGFFSILVNLLLGSSDLNVDFFYFSKEIEFFLLYFFVFYCVSYFDLSRRLIKYWFFFALINIFWLLYVYAFKVEWSISYGPNAFFEPKGPFPSGGFFLMLFIFFINLSVFYYSSKKITKFEKIALFVLSVLPAIGVISSGSRTSVIGLFVSVVVVSLLYASQRMGLVRILKSVALLAVIIFIFFQMMNFISVVEEVTYGDPTNIVNRISLGMTVSAYPSSRFSAVKEHLIQVYNFSPINIFIGLGINGEAHSQYMRVLMERGIIGLILFLWLIASILKISYDNSKSKDDGLKKGLAAGLFVSTIVMIVMAIPNDVFAVVKPDEVYWFFSAMALATIVKPNNLNAESS